MKEVCENCKWWQRWVDDTGLVIKLKTGSQFGCVHFKEV